MEVDFLAMRPVIAMFMIMKHGSLEIVKLLSIEDEMMSGQMLDRCCTVSI
jgi:hypothetical protein